MEDKKIIEYRGIEGLVGAILKEDTEESLTYETPFYIAGTSELTRETETASEAHYYDNRPAVVIDATGADTVNVNVSAVPMNVIAKLTGQKHNEEKGLLIEGGAVAPYMAIGYITEDTDGKRVFVWRHKGKFSRPSETHATKNSGTDANGQELTFTGIATNYRSPANNNEPLTATVCLAEKCGMTQEEFFAKVQTADDIIGAGGSAGEEPQG